MAQKGIIDFLDSYLIYKKVKEQLIFIKHMCSPGEGFEVKLPTEGNKITRE